MALVYTKFQLNRTKTVGGVIWKQKSLQTDGQTDGLMPRAVFKRAYKNYPLLSTNTPSYVELCLLVLIGKLMVFRCPNI